jgi:RNA polymerase sigma-70 factor (ECF subfamily)
MNQAVANPEVLTNEELMTRFQGGDAAALEELFARFQKPLFNYFYRMLGRRETSEDLVQETFLKVCRFGTSFRGSEAKFSTWLFSVAGNQCRDYIRHSSRRPETLVEDSELHEVADDGGPSLHAYDSSAEDHLMRMELQDILKKAIHSLPEKEKNAIILREYEGLEYKEIAEALSCPIGSVKVLIYRARQKLREKLDKLEV